jgi:hypothetical protein
MHHTGGVALKALPHTRGVALNAGITAIPGASSSSGQELDPLTRVREVVVGSPIWVEQVGA